MTGLFIAPPPLACYGTPVTPVNMQDIKDDLTNWMDQAGKNPVLTKEQVFEIAREIQALDKDAPKRKELVSKLVLHNMRLVIKFVHNFMRSKSAYKWGSVETTDFLQVGIFGLYRAAEKFDPERGYTFSTYANHWIRSFVSRYNMKASSPFKMSEEMCRNAYAYQKYGKIYSSSKGGPEWRENPERMVQLVRAAQSPVALHCEFEPGRSFIDLLAEREDTRIEFYENSFSPEVEQTIKEASLTEEEDRIIRMTFLHSKKWAEINEMGAITSNQYAATKESALKKLRRVADPAILGV